MPNIIEHGDLSLKSKIQQGLDVVQVGLSYGCGYLGGAIASTILAEEKFALSKLPIGQFAAFSGVNAIGYGTLMLAVALTLKTPQNFSRLAKFKQNTPRENIEAGIHALTPVIGYIGGIVDYGSRHLHP